MYLVFGSMIKVSPLVSCIAACSCRLQLFIIVVVLETCRIGLNSFIGPATEYCYGHCCVIEAIGFKFIILFRSFNIGILLVFHNIKC